MRLVGPLVVIVMLVLLATSLGRRGGAGPAATPALPAAAGAASNPVRRVGDAVRSAVEQGAARRAEDAASR